MFPKGSICHGSGSDCLYRPEPGESSRPNCHTGREPRIKKMIHVRVDSDLDHIALSAAGAVLAMDGNAL